MAEGVEARVQVERAELERVAVSLRAKLRDTRQAAAEAERRGEAEIQQHLAAQRQLIAEFDAMKVGRGAVVGA